MLIWQHSIQLTIFLKLSKSKTLQQQLLLKCLFLSLKALATPARRRLTTQRVSTTTKSSLCRRRCTDEWRSNRDVFYATTATSDVQMTSSTWPTGCVPVGDRAWFRFRTASLSHQSSANVRVISKCILRHHIGVKKVISHFCIVASFNPCPSPRRRKWLWFMTRFDWAVLEISVYCNVVCLNAILCSCLNVNCVIVIHRCVYYKCGWLDQPEW